MNSLAKLTITAEDGRQEPGKSLQSLAKIGCELITKSFHCDAGIDVVNGPLLQSSVLYQYGNWQLGSELFINSHLEDKDQSPAVSDVNVGLAYQGPGWSLVARTTDVLDNLRVSYLHHVTKSLSFATLIDYRLKLNSQKISMGTKYL